MKNKPICDSCYDLLGQPAVVCSMYHKPCYFCGKESDSQAVLFGTPAEAISRMNNILDRYKNGYKGSCYTCESVGMKNIELESALLEIKRISPGNGEDCAFLIARNALYPAGR